jgi:hypothetical protein
MVTININKKDLYIVGAIIIFFMGSGIVIAIGSNNYQVEGHDFNEIQKCGEGQILKISGGNWVCGNEANTGLKITGSGDFEWGQESIGYLNIGANRNCYTWIARLKQKGGCSGGSVYGCDYNSGTGNIEASMGCGSIYLKCRYICFG